MARRLERLSRPVILVGHEPHLSALSGETASFLAGGEFPVPVGYLAGRISMENRPAGPCPRDPSFRIA